MAFLCEIRPISDPVLPALLPARQARQYTLRREAWRLFCPSFIHYTRQMRSRAWEAALAGWSATTTSTTTSTTTTASSGNTNVNGGLGAAGAAAAGAAGPGTGTGGAAYCPHWQLLRPRGRLPLSLDPMHRVLEAGSTWRVVGWVMQVRGGRLRRSFSRPAPGLSNGPSTEVLQLAMQRPGPRGPK